MRRVVLSVVSIGFMFLSPVLIAAQEPTPTCESTPGCVAAYIDALQHTRVQLEKEVIRLRYELDRLRETVNRSDPKGGGPK